MQHCFIEGVIVKADPETKTTGTGLVICNFTIGLQRKFGKKDADGRTKTDFMPCTAFGKTAENIAKYFKKHSVIQLDGEFQDNGYQKNDKGYIIPYWQFVVNSFNFPPIVKKASDVEDDGFNPITGNAPKADNKSSSFDIAEAIGNLSDFQEISTSDDALPF